MADMAHQGAIIIGDRSEAMARIPSGKPPESFLNWQGLGSSSSSASSADRNFWGYSELVLIVKLAVAMATRSHFSKAAIRVPLRNPDERTRK